MTERRYLIIGATLLFLSLWGTLQLACAPIYGPASGLRVGTVYPTANGCTLMFNGIGFERHCPDVVPRQCLPERTCI